MTDDDDIMQSGSPFAESAPTPFGPGQASGSLPPLPPLEHFDARPRAPTHGGPPGRGSKRDSNLPMHHSLESLYAHTDGLGTDQVRFRVERIEPEWVRSEWGQTYVAGVLGYLDDAIDTQAFANRFGGRRYKVYAVAQLPHSKTGVPISTDVGYAHFRIPLEPNLDELPIVDGDMSSPYKTFDPLRKPNYFFQAQSPSGPSTREYLELMREGVNLGKNSTGTDNSTPLNFVSGLTQQHMSTVQQAAERQAEVYREQLASRERQIEELRREMRELQHRPTSQGETLGGIAQILGAMKASTGEQESSVLRAQHEREIDRLKDDYQRQLDGMRRDHQRELDQMRASIEAEKSRYAERERDIMRDQERREQLLRDEMERRERAAKIDAEREVKLLRESYETQLRSTKDSAERESKLIELSKESQLRTSENTNKVLTASLQEKLATLQAERESMRAELDMLRAQAHKPVHDVIRETKELASTLGMREGGEGGAEIPKGRVDALLETFAEAAGKNLPAVIGKLGNIASKAKKTPTAQTQVLSSTPNAPQRPRQEPMRFVDDDYSAPPKQMRSAPQQQTQAPPPEPKPQQPQAQPQEPRPSRPPSIAPDPSTLWQGFEWTSLDPGALENIFGSILHVMTSGGTPDAAAKMLTDQHGTDAMALVSQYADIERVLASVVSAPATRHTPLATKQGRNFLRAAWEALQQSTSQTDETQPEPAEQPSIPEVQA